MSVKTPLKLPLSPDEPPARVADRVFHDTLAQVEGDPARAAFFARALEVLRRLTTGLSSRALGASLAAGSGIEGLVTALASPGVFPMESEESGLLLRGIAAKRRMLEAEGGTLAAEEVERLLGISRQQVNNRRRQGKLLAVEVGRRGFRYPAWQFDAQGCALKGLALALGELAEADPWSRILFFLEANERLTETGSRARTPLEALREGRVEDVRRAARAWERHGAA